MANREITKEDTVEALTEVERNHECENRKGMR